MTALVRDVIRRGPVFVEPLATLRDLARVLDEEVIGAALVKGARHSSGVVLAGIVSERDLVHAIADGKSLDRTRVMDLMTGDMATARPDEPILEAAKTMLDFEIRHLPVVDGDEVVGVVSARDLLAALVSLAAGTPGK